MARAKQLPRVHRYSLEFKLSAVRLSKLPGVQSPAGRRCAGHPPLHALALAQAGARGRAARQDTQDRSSIARLAVELRAARRTPAAATRCLSRSTNC